MNYIYDTNSRLHFLSTMVRGFTFARCNINQMYPTYPHDSHCRSRLFYAFVMYLDLIWPTIAINDACLRWLVCLRLRESRPTVQMEDKYKINEPLCNCLWRSSDIRGTLSLPSHNLSHDVFSFLLNQLDFI